jgi:hypothetical protein
MTPKSLYMIREIARAKREFVDYGSPTEEIRDFKPIKFEIPDYQKPRKPKAGWYMFFRNIMP